MSIEAFDKIRAEFEERFPVPANCHYDESFPEYVSDINNPRFNNTADNYNYIFQGWLGAAAKYKEPLE